jgi:hypothetical protein
MVFSTSSKKPYTPPEWAGTPLRAFFAVRKQSPPQVTPVEGSCHWAFDSLYGKLYSGEYTLFSMFSHLKRKLVVLSVGNTFSSSTYTV